VIIFPIELRSVMQYLAVSDFDTESRTNNTERNDQSYIYRIYIWKFLDFIT